MDLSLGSAGMVEQSTRTLDVLLHAGDLLQRMYGRRGIESLSHIRHKPKRRKIRKCRISVRSWREVCQVLRKSHPRRTHVYGHSVSGICRFVEQEVWYCVMN